MISVTQHFNRGLIYRLTIFVIAFYFAYWYGMTFTPDYPSPLWFPDSVLLCALLISPRSTWWIYILAPLPIRLTVAVVPDTSVWFLIASFVNDSLKGLLAASLLRRKSDEAPWFHSVRGFISYLLVAVALAPALSAVAGAATRMAFGATQAFWPAWWQWFLGNALANLSLTPALCCLLLDSPGVIQAPKTRRIEVLAILSGLAVGAYLAFHNGLGGLNYPLWVLYLPVPFVLWAAVRFGPLGTSVVLTTISVVAMFGALTGQGIFSSPKGASVVSGIQQFLLVPSIPFLVFSVLITAARKTEAALREREQWFRSMVNTTPVLVWMSNAEGLRTFFNERWINFTGRSVEEELGNGWLKGVHEEDQEACISESRAVLENGRNLSVEYRLRRNDGVYRWVLESGIPRYHPNGEFLGYLGTCIDITERREAEDALRQVPHELIHAEETERQRIGQELHDDLGQRVVSLTIGIERLTKQMPRNETVLSYADKLRQQALSIAQDISRLSHQLRPVTLDYLGLPAALKVLCEQASDPAHVSVVFSQQGEMPQSVPAAVPLALYRVTQEALRNALTHSGSNRITIDLSCSERVLTIVIADNGRGFINGTTKKPGLGLSGMTKRMNDVGGTVNVVSVPGVGVTVRASVQIVKSATAP
jgi:PAS domain S-box-containing protein